MNSFFIAVQDIPFESNNIHLHPIPEIINNKSLLC